MSMYEFRDLTDQPGAAALPAEAVSINGEYIENQVSGYRTLYATGREALSPELNTFEVGSRDGSLLRSRRYPSRTITVGYQLTAASPEAFREAYNKLGGLLNVQDAQLVFNDEPDKYFTGTPSGLAEVDAGKLSVTAEFEILCLDPVKYALEETEVTPDSAGVMTTNYDGTFPAAPKFTAVATGELGFVGFFDESRHVIQIGDPDEPDIQLDGYLSVNLTGSNGSFTKNGLTGWTTGSAKLPSKYSSRPQNGTMTTSTTDGLKVSAFGDPSSTSKWCGASVSLVLPADTNGDTGAASFTLDWNQTFSAGNVKQIGETMITVAGTDASGNSHNIAAIRFYKTTRNSTLWIETIAYDQKVSVKRINSLAAANKTLNGWGQISKQGKKFYFKVPGYSTHISIEDAENALATEISIYMSRYTGRDIMKKQCVREIRFRKHNVAMYSDIPNKIAPGDTVVADCATGQITVNGLEDPSLGALGNDWETFRITPGTWKCGATWSSWAPEDEAPEVKLTYRKAWL